MNKLRDFNQCDCYEICDEVACDSDEVHSDDADKNTTATAIHVARLSLFSAF